MSKRQASEALDEVHGIDSPASKKSRFDTPEIASNGDHTTEEARPDHDEDDDLDEPVEAAPIRQAAPTEGYDDLYLDTINRNVLDFDFEKLCSISLSNINVYACLVCGKYFQGRGPKTHAYFHSLDEDHHVFINMETHRVYVLPEGYEVKSKSLDDIRYVSDPTYSRRDVADLDRKSRTAFTLDSRQYHPGYVGINNIKENDYFNVVIQALAHVQPLRNFMLLEDLTSRPELVRRCSTLFRKIWNPRAFKNHVSPHELLQDVALRSNKRFNLTHQSDPVDFLSWFLNNLHLGLGGSRTKPGSSIIQRIFQGKLRVESQAITTRLANPGDPSMAAGSGAGLRFEDATEVQSSLSRFLLLTLDLPPAPLFQDEQEGNIIPQVPLSALLRKYDGVTAQEHASQRRRHRLVHPLPPYLLFHVKRFSSNRFVSERNPTIVTFDARNGLDVGPFVEPNPDLAPPGEPVWYDLVANVVHEAVRAKDDVVAGESAGTGDSEAPGGGGGGGGRKVWKVQLRDRARDEWVVCQDLFVEPAQKELLYLGSRTCRCGRGGGRAPGRPGSRAFRVGYLDMLLLLSWWCEAK